MDKQEQQWQPISMLPVFTEMVDGMLESSAEQLFNMRLVVNKPHVLDDATMDRILTLYTEQLDDHYLFTNQFDRWKQENLKGEELVEVDRLIAQSHHLKKVNEAILKIAHSIEHNTIDKILAMNEIDLIESVLSGKIQAP